MKNLFLILFTSVLSFAQNNSKLVINYKLTYLSDSLNEYSIKDDVMSLEILGNRSVFYSKLRKQGDSALQEDIKKGLSQMEIVANRGKYHSGKIGYIVHKNRNEDKVVFTDKIFMDAYLYEEKMPKIDWTIINDVEDFLGYKVRKATGHFAGRNYTAWFAEDIPISDGPYKFNNLPGLILKVEDTKGIFSFQAQEILKSNEMAFAHPVYSKAIPTTKEKYSQLKERSVKNMVAYINTSTEVQIKSKNPIKEKEKPYNPIELKPY